MVKSKQVETLIEKIRIIEGSGAYESVNLDSLTNFPQVIIPPKFKAPEFVKYDSTKDPLLWHIFLDSLIGPTATWYVRLEKTSS